ncbi:hypothetical protein RUM43_009293 [Polyplax serrata]|uniref:Uncharacterized protein n=1 Tax=Polyplax serrata TaxID=468196 RepID=A0AAN8NQ51_POLSC
MTEERQNTKWQSPGKQTKSEKKKLNVKRPQSSQTQTFTRVRRGKPSCRPATFLYLSYRKCNFGLKSPEQLPGDINLSGGVAADKEPKPQFSPNRNVIKPNGLVFFDHFQVMQTCLEKIKNKKTKDRQEDAKRTKKRERERESKNATQEEVKNKAGLVDKTQETQKNN